MTYRAALQAEFKRCDWLVRFYFWQCVCAMVLSLCAVGFSVRLFFTDTPTRAQFAAVWTCSAVAILMSAHGRYMQQRAMKRGREVMRDLLRFDEHTEHTTP